MLNTFLGLHQVGIEFKPTLFNLSIASSTLSKLLIIAFELSHSILVYSPKYLENTLLPLPLAPTIQRILKSNSFNIVGNSNG